MENKVGHYGITKFTEVKSATEIHGEEIKIKGYSIIENILDEEDLLIANNKLAEIYSKQLKELENKEIISTIKDIDITRALLAYDDFFLYKVAANPQIISLVSHLLGNYFILREQNGITNRPNLPNYQLKWHRDLVYQNFVSSIPIAISVLYCLDDFTIKTGGTYILPSSHKIDSFPSTSYIERNELCVNAKAGSAIVFDSMLFHRAGYNSSEHVRRAINNVYALPFIKQPISLPAILKDNFKDDPFMNIFLGFDSDTDSSVYEWRMRRYNRVISKNDK